MATLLEKIVTDLTSLEYFSQFKFRKRDSRLIMKTSDGMNYIELEHWYYFAASMVVRPIYGVRFDILSRWFEKFCFKTLQDQRDGASIFFDGKSLSMPNEFEFEYNNDRNYAVTFEKLQSTLKKCSEFVFNTYSTLEKLYDNTIQPILNGDRRLQEGSPDWFFIDLTLCKIVSPETYGQLKAILLKDVDRRVSGTYPEPNMAYYYNRLDEILSYLESLSVEDLMKKHITKDEEKKYKKEDRWDRSCLTNLKIKSSSEH